MFSDPQMNYTLFARTSQLKNENNPTVIHNIYSTTNNTSRWVVKQ